MSESKSERYTFLRGTTHEVDGGGLYYDSREQRAMTWATVTALLNEHERWREERAARASITVNGEPASTVDAATIPQTTQTTYACFPCKLTERMKRLEQRFESLDDCVCETDDAVAELRRRLDSAQNQAQAPLLNLNDAAERAHEAAHLRAQEPPVQWHDTPQYATTQNIEELRDAIAGGFSRFLHEDIERLGADLREQLTAMHADLGKALAAAQVGGGEKLLAVESTVRNGIERVLRMLHDAMARMPAQKNAQ